MGEAITIATWNAEWISGRSGRFQSALDRIAELDADILVLTEASLDLIPEHGHTALGGADWGYPKDESRRKVILWSKWQIEDVDDRSVQPPGRHVGVTTSTPLGPIRVHAVCVPWRDAHVSTGRRDAASWSEHLDFLESLKSTLAYEAEDPDLNGLPVALAGDFNRRDGEHPYGSKETGAAWLELQSEAGLKEVTPSDIIDKVAVSSNLKAARIETLDPDGISDHHAVSVEVDVI